MGEHLFFGPYELVTDSGELLREGERVRLQPQAARLLELLARRSGEVVSREEIRNYLWGEETFVELEQGLNFAVRKIRIALEDSATQPRYLETVPRRGYRFLPPVRTEPAAGEASAGAARPAAEEGPRGSWFRIGGRVAVGLVLGLMLFAAPQHDRRGSADLSPRLEDLSPPAFQAYNEGRFLAQRLFTGRGAPDDRERALAAFQEAMLLAPDFAPASAAYARLRLDFRRPPDETVARVEGIARHSLDLSPCLNEARLVLVDIGLYFRFDWELARTELDRALACDPLDSEVHRAQAAYFAVHGRFDEAMAAARRALLLDPQSKVAFADLAWYSFLARRYDEALDLARWMLVLEPNDGWTRQILIDAALAAGKPEIALAEANALLAMARSRGWLPIPPEHVESLGPFWDWLARRLTTIATRAPLRSLDLAVPVLHLRDTGRALALVEEANRRKFGWGLAFLAVDPRFDALRAEPRFHRVLRSLGLADVASTRSRVAWRNEGGAPPTGTAPIRSLQASESLTARLRAS